MVPVLPELLLPREARKLDCLRKLLSSKTSALWKTRMTFPLGLSGAASELEMTGHTRELGSLAQGLSEAAASEID